MGCAATSCSGEYIVRMHAHPCPLCAGLFEVQRINPPPKSLGIHSLPVNTHNGDQITIDDEVGPCFHEVSLLLFVSDQSPMTRKHGAPHVQDFVVTSLVLQYKLVGGRYQKDHNRLEVQQTSRYIVNLYYEGLLERSA